MVLKKLNDWNNFNKIIIKWRVLIALEDEVNSSVKDYVLKNTTTPQRDIEDILHEANEKYDFYEYIWERVVYGK